MTRPTHVLFVGSTGSTGRLAVDEAVRAGYAVRALVRSAAHARFDPRVDVFQGDLTDVASLREALDGMDGVVFTMGAHDGPCMVEKVDYGAVRNTSLALDGRKVRIALMTAIGVTYMDTDYNRVSQAHDWKRRSERLVRASGNETPSCAPAGSTTTIRTSRGSFSCRATPIAMPVPRTAWYPANRSRRCWSVRSDARRRP